jgi:hypothetical protein
MGIAAVIASMGFLILCKAAGLYLLAASSN